ncbi:HNH endonuclease [Thermobifida halotolerans]|uniref:HNH endonuclease n=1 Tax=Thermobifida halotolerans TaxID=483545 RepID=A0AA97LVI1_9ACTN|nr:HNH endonuclease [Thermobifida halotolerans]UOE18859.1 HNH endonuclease [Thermobifida halotolerans]
MRDPAWAWEEIVLACALVEQNGRRELREHDPATVELSRLLQRLPIHPPSVRSGVFRSPGSVSRKTTDLATRYPGYWGKPTRGSKKDQEVVNAFVEAPEQMLATAARIRENALTGRLHKLLPVLDEVEPEEVSAAEGRLLYLIHRTRERDPKLRKAKIRQTRTAGRPVACEVCGFDFGRTYGQRGADYIECHHIVPLHHIGESVTRLEDLALLCSNCHRMIHRTRPWLTPGELKEIVENRR